MKHRASKSLGVRCFPCPLSSHCLPDRKRKRFLASARNDDAGKAAFSLLPLEGGGAQRRRLASLSFAFGQPPALRASPFHGKGGRWVTHPASPSFLWKEVARSAGGWLRSFSPSANPRPSGIPLPWEGGRWATHSPSPSFQRKEGEIEVSASLYILQV